MVKLVIVSSDLRPSVLDNQVNRRVVGFIFHKWCQPDLPGESLAVTWESLAEASVAPPKARSETRSLNGPCSSP